MVVITNYSKLKQGTFESRKNFEGHWKYWFSLGSYGPKEFINSMFRPKILQVFSISDYMEKRRDQFPLGYEGPSQVAGSCEVAAGLMPLVHIQGEGN